MLRDLGIFMELRSKVLAWQPISKNPQKVKKAPLPPGLQDDWGAPPVVMWCAPLNAKQAQPASKKPRHRMEESAGTGSASWSSSASSWSTWWGAECFGLGFARSEAVVRTYSALPGATASRMNVRNVGWLWLFSVTLLAAH